VRVLMIGGGGHASDILGAFEAVAHHSGERKHVVIGIVADEEVDQRRFAHRGVRQLGAISDIKKIDASHYVLGIGFSQPRQAVDARVANLGLSAASVIHPLADVPPGTLVGEGTVILSGVRVSPLVTIGRHVCLSNGCIVGHDCKIGDYVSVLPGAAVSGDTLLGEASLIGSNATILQKLKIGERSIVGAGAVVVKDVAPKTTVVGNPARLLARPIRESGVFWPD
jgi:sugar O-acyltransferase (sialic acid O-acetyltransferase NeuD family)